jgi:hypothetical protein
MQMIHVQMGKTTNSHEHGPKTISKSIGVHITNKQVNGNGPTIEKNEWDHPNL